MVINHVELFQTCLLSFSGLNSLYHLSYWLVPTTGFCITVSVGILVALCRNALKISAPLPEKQYMSSFFSRLSALFQSDEKPTSADSKHSNGIQLNDKIQLNDRKEQPAV